MKNVKRVLEDLGLYGVRKHTDFLFVILQHLSLLTGVGESF